MSYEIRVMRYETQIVIPAKAGIQFKYLSRANQFCPHNSYLMSRNSVKSEILK